MKNELIENLKIASEARVAEAQLGALAGKRWCALGCVFFYLRMIMDAYYQLLVL